MSLAEFGKAIELYAALLGAPPLLASNTVAGIWRIQLRCGPVMHHVSAQSYEVAAERLLASIRQSSVRLLAEVGEEGGHVAG